MRRLRELYSETCFVQQTLSDLRREMGFPNDVQIEHAKRER